MRSASLGRQRWACLALSIPLASACAEGTLDRQPQPEPEPEIRAEDLPDTTEFENTPVGRHGRLHVEGTHLVDEHGEAVQLRGVSSMWLNWEYTGYAENYTALQWMRDAWGVSVIRGAVGVSDGNKEPASGGYLQDPALMLADIDRIVNNASKLGMYALIDWHDHWAIDHKQQAEKFFREMTARHGDKVNVLYETFNEPITSSFGGGDGLTWEDDLLPYHQELVEAIREGDPEGVIILGTPNWSQYVDDVVNASAMVEGENLMYTVHFYSCDHQQRERQRMQRALSAGLPIFVTEWGATDASGGQNNTRLCLESADAWMAVMDQYGLSWTAWKLDDCDEASCLLAPGAPVDGPFNGYLFQAGHGPYLVEKLLDGRARDEVGREPDPPPATDAGAIDGNASADASSRATSDAGGG